MEVKTKQAADDKTIKKYTHAYLQNKELTEIPKFSVYEKLSVLCLFENKITKIENLEPLANLTNLYLQKNEIKVIENLNFLTKLRRLNLGHNRISVVENLEHLINLQELYIERQTLSECDSLCFDPRTMANLKYLQILNISHNNIRSIINLAPLGRMRVFTAAGNKIDDVTDILKTIANWYHLFEASFEGNPVTKKHRYRENIIAQTMRLEMLDKKQVNEMTRNFMQKFNQQTRVKNINLADIHDLPNNYPEALQKAASSSLIKTGLLNPKKLVENTKHYVAWKALPNTQPIKLKSRSFAQSKTEL